MKQYEPLKSVAKPDVVSYVAQIHDDEDLLKDYPYIGTFNAQRFVDEEWDYYTTHFLVDVDVKEAQSLLAERVGACLDNGHLKEFCYG